MTDADCYIKSYYIIIIGIIIIICFVYHCCTTQTGYLELHHIYGFIQTQRVQI
jgi:hypothetical protein